jgi:predicted N-acetyltransferase YhbS
MMLEIRQQNPDDEDSVESLMQEAFGDVRHTRSVWALRPGPPVQRLCLMGVDDGVAVGSLRFWEIMLGEARILLLGPLAVRPEMRGKGYGQRMVKQGLTLAQDGGWPLVLVSGEPHYYPKFGFVPAAGYQLDWPGFVEPDRLQLYEVTSGALAALAARPDKPICVRAIAPIP